MIVHLIILTLVQKERSLLSAGTIRSICEIAIVVITIIIVSIPEGLPLAVSIAMALSINRLKKDKILIKNLEAI